MWIVLHANNAATVSKSAKGFANTASVIVTVFEVSGLVCSTLVRTPCCCKHGTRHPRLQSSSSNSRATVKTDAAIHVLGAFIPKNADLMDEINRRPRLMRTCCRWLGPDLYDRTTAALNQKVRMLKAGVIKNLLLYGCVVCTLAAQNHAKFRSPHHKVFRRIVFFQRRIDHINLAYVKALKKMTSESIETTICKWDVLRRGGNDTAERGTVT